jgi:capsular polysaccharide transport system permease protein
MTEIVASPQAEDGAPAQPIRMADRPSTLVFQYRVLKAILLRDIAQRGGENRIGFLLSIITPIVTITTIAVFFGLRGKVIPTNMPLSVFVITGYPLWINFQSMYTKAMQAAGRSDPLLMFPQITQLDVILATIILEFATNTVVFFVLALGAIIIFGAKPPADVFGVILCSWGCMWIGAAMGMVLCGLHRVSPVVTQFLNTFMRFGMWISGVIYSINRLPSFLWPYLRWNPILHLIEGCRHLWTPDFDAPIFSPAYILAIGFILTTLGFVIERMTRRLVD